MQQNRNSPADGLEGILTTLIAAVFQRKILFFQYPAEFRHIEMYPSAAVVGPVELMNDNHFILIDLKPPGSFNI